MFHESIFLFHVAPIIFKCKNILIYLDVVLYIFYIFLPKILIPLTQFFVYIHRILKYERYSNNRTAKTLAPIECFKIYSSPTLPHTHDDKVDTTRTSRWYYLNVQKHKQKLTNKKTKKPP